MDDYRINCAISCPAACGFIGMVTGMFFKILGVSPVLTPAIISFFGWWPADLLFSGAMIGALCGVVGAAIAIAIDISHESTLRAIAPRRI